MTANGTPCVLPSDQIVCNSTAQDIVGVWCRLEPRQPSMLCFFIVDGAAEIKPEFALNHLLFASLTLSAAAFGFTNSSPCTGVKTKEDESPFVWPELMLAWGQWSTVNVEGERCSAMIEEISGEMEQRKVRK
jgi:hypothetical protein